jgi:hypothetical protein
VLAANLAASGIQDSVVGGQSTREAVDEAAEVTIYAIEIDGCPVIYFRSHAHALRHAQRCQAALKRIPLARIVTIKTITVHETLEDEG